MSSNTTKHLQLSDVSIDFPTPNGVFRALDRVNLNINKGEFISLIGHSGCGKSTVLNIVAGLLESTTGGVILDGREVNEPGPDRAVVFQNHSLLPWLSAWQNVELAVKQVFKGKKTRVEMDEWVRHNLELVHMGHAMDKRPDEISGGMKQRVGIARALAMEPKVLLMDEPFGALDALTRAHMQDSLLEIHSRLGNTVIMITHDVDEAVLLSDRIVMMTNGPEATVGEILDVKLDRPRNRLQLAEDRQYNHYRAEVVRFLHDRHQHPSAPGMQGASSQVSLLARGGPEKTSLKLGFVPLTDCAPLAIAQELDFFSDCGLEVTLSRESSWANVRDKVLIGSLDGSQMPAGIPLSRAVFESANPMVTAFNMSLGGNAVTVSTSLYDAMAATGAVDLHNPLQAGIALKEVLASQDRKPAFAVVFPESSHNYLLRYWLASSGIDPDRDVDIITVPPSQVVDFLRDGRIAGYCVGEPWNSQAVRETIGRILFASQAIWNNHPEKVFAVTRNWAQQYPVTHAAILRALTRACAWLDDAANRDEACDILSRKEYVGLDRELIALSMQNTLRYTADEKAVPVPDMNVFYRYCANFPWLSHGTWTMMQMIRWGQYDENTDIDYIVRNVYRPDIYRELATSMDLDIPMLDEKEEGIHSSPWELGGEISRLRLGADMFFDKLRFDPHRIRKSNDSVDKEESTNGNMQL